MAGIPITWDQGSSSIVPSLPGFQKSFGITSGSNPSQIFNFISFVYLTAGVGSGLSLFINDRIGSLRLYMCIWIIGQLIATFSDGHLDALYTARFIASFGIGPPTVTGPTSIIVWFVPCIVIAVTIVLNFSALSESPRWLMLVGHEEEALQTLTGLKCLPSDDPESRKEHAKYGGGGFGSVVKETFLVRANLRRVIQACLSYALAQLSGANSVTSYLVPTLTLVGVGGRTDRNMFLVDMYSMTKFFYTLMVSFFFIDALGRLKSLYLGVTVQMISYIYIGVYLKDRQAGTNSMRSRLTFTLGLLVLPYIFSARLWPNNICSFGSALTQSFHWLFYFGVNKGTPDMLSGMENWVSFLFFAGYCLISLIYVFVAVPKTTGLSLEHIDQLFEGPFWQMQKKMKMVKERVAVIESID
ncbi:MFS general substrate transporter [Amniculicola lignicola CBS 123094]|uniref:MFS general substrate transporter n=1 Tax=Amniculicola lignicola CBS 123094 TaxID=1392246 RepID=A0A6A5W6Y1_9PLEO|nr:MFS general substrate transporter [Amniculicola lignicola CBS 123094]